MAKPGHQRHRGLRGEGRQSSAAISQLPRPRSRSGDSSLRAGTWLCLLINSEDAVLWQGLLQKA